MCCELVMNVLIGIYRVDVSKSFAFFSCSHELDCISGS